MIICCLSFSCPRGSGVWWRSVRLAVCCLRRQLSGWVVRRVPYSYSVPQSISCTRVECVAQPSDNMHPVAKYINIEPQSPDRLTAVLQTMESPPKKPDMDAVLRLSCIVSKNMCKLIFQGSLLICYPTYPTVV